MDGEESLLAIELEALNASCDADDLDVSTEGTVTSIRVMVSAREAEDFRFVEAHLHFALPSGYPGEEGPAIQLLPARTRGLGDHREGELLQHLRQEAQQLAGELMIGHLIEVSLLHAVATCSAMRQSKCHER